MHNPLLWKTLHAMQQGTAHQDHQLPCQDACGVLVLENCCVAVLSDGAGSASRGGAAARFVCDQLLQAFAKAEINAQSITLELVRNQVLGVRDQLLQWAADQGESARDYACTLLLAVLTEQRSIFVQIGDGGMVVMHQNIQGVVFWPAQGLYANMTYFLTDQNALQHLQSIEISVTVQAVALFSDGLQSLALDYASRTAHAGFFTPMFLRLQRMSSAPLGVQLDSQLLQDFLASAPVNARTDDDKSLVLITRLT